MLTEENENKVITTSQNKRSKHSVIQNKIIERNVINQLNNINNNSNITTINKNNKSKKIIIINSNDNLTNTNQRSSSVPIKVKSTKQFLKKFSGRCEITGKNYMSGGILSPENKNVNVLNNSILPPLNRSTSDVSFNSDLSHKSTSYVSKIDNWKRYGISNSHKHNHSIFQDRSYVPHNYKEYTQQMNEYKCIKFGGIGDNMGTLDWSKRFMKFKKMNLYGIRIVAEHLRNLNHNRLGPKEERTMELKKKYENSIRFKINKYGKEIMLNNMKELKKVEIQKQKEIVENKRYKSNEREIISRNEGENEFGREHSEIREITRETMESNKEEYTTKLNRLKESLISDFRWSNFK
jgi:hypothetical protein